MGTCAYPAPKELVEVGKKIVNKCRGLPLAIVVLGGFLSRKHGNIHEWSKVLARINWQLNQDQTQCSEILALSYSNLPFHIKSCFLYVGIFPEDSEIFAERLIQLWISEGFVQQQRGEEVVEDAAEDYLEELIDRCMIQVEARRPNGIVETCRIHDLLRDLSISKAKGLNKSLIENCAITLGRLAWVCPDIVSPHMEHFMQSWCTALSMIRDDIEKEDAFRGLCAMVRSNPSGALSSLVYMCRAIASWHEIRSEDLHNEVCQVLNGYKQMLRNGGWEQCMSALEPPVKDKLSKYQV